MPGTSPNNRRAVREGLGHRLSATRKGKGCGRKDTCTANFAEIVDKAPPAPKTSGRADQSQIEIRKTA